MILIPNAVPDSNASRAPAIPFSQVLLPWIFFLESVQLPQQLLAVTAASFLSALPSSWWPSATAFPKLPSITEVAAITCEPFPVVQS